ncbi:sensor histidine kinase [Streptomonospora sp. S1-112]|uniref:histidine kinase n=1 Tax=Streptomonospora mangrovi TaxID=2883123 RepID=A0A9X3NGY9_9ACTN|nr:sensor histidine kinase [Streptomonospora mangrovi]MDA0562855.1 sensor histidine kinase [Streptomonospora mangrovi]
MNGHGDSGHPAPRRRRAARPLLLDVPVALAVGAVSLAGVHAQGAWAERGGRGPDPAGPPWTGPPPDLEPAPAVVYVCVAVVVAALAVRRLYPRSAFTAAMAAVAVAFGVLGSGGPIVLAPMLCAYTLAVRLPPRRWLPLTVLGVPVFLALRLDQPYLGLATVQAVADLVVSLALLLGPAALGVIVRSRRENLRRERAQELSRSVYEERLRIAREVHDVVGHSLSVINMQAGVALHVLDKRPERAQPALEAIRQTSKDALEELRGTLAVFRTPEGGAPADTREPPPGLDRLDDLVAGIASAGRTVEVRVEGERAALPAAVDHAAYRIVQEALTNVVRHAGGAGATVAVAYRPKEVTVEITDTGPARPGSPPAEGGGIAGMRERARAVGGRLAAGPRPEGGFAVRAELPRGER